MFIHTEHIVCILLQHLPPDTVMRIMADMASGVTPNTRGTTAARVKECEEMRATLRVTMARTKVLLTKVAGVGVLCLMGASGCRPAVSGDAVAACNAGPKPSAEMVSQCEEWSGVAEYRRHALAWGR